MLSRIELNLSSKFCVLQVPDECDNDDDDSFTTDPCLNLPDILQETDIGMFNTDERLDANFPQCLEVSVFCSR